MERPTAHKMNPFQIHNAGGIAMALMDSELIYGQIPWAIVTFLQAGFKRQPTPYP